MTDLSRHTEANDRYPALGARVLVSQTITKRHLSYDDGEYEDYHATPSVLVRHDHEPPLEGVVVGMTSLMTEDEHGGRRRDTFVGVREHLRGRMHRVELASIRLADRSEGST